MTPLTNTYTLDGSYVYCQFIGLITKCEPKAHTSILHYLCNLVIRRFHKKNLMMHVLTHQNRPSVHMSHFLSKVTVYNSLGFYLIKNLRLVFQFPTMNFNPGRINNRFLLQ